VNPTMNGTLAAACWCFALCKDSGMQCVVLSIWYERGV